MTRLDSSRPALCWAYGAGVVNGVLAGRYGPYGSFTRAHIVTMLYRAEHRAADFFETAVYLGVEDYGTEAADKNRLDAFRYRFFSRGETWTCAMAPRLCTASMAIKTILFISFLLI